MFASVWLSLLACSLHALPISFVSFLLVCCRLSFAYAYTHMEYGHSKQRGDLLGASKKGKDAIKRMQAHKGKMFNRLGRLAPLEWFSLTLSLSLFSRSCIRDPFHVPPLLFLLFSWAMFLGFGNSVLHFLYLAGPYLWNVGNVCFTFLLCVIALCMMYVYVCIYIYACVCVGDYALCMMNSCGYVSDPY